MWRGRVNASPSPSFPLSFSPRRLSLEDCPLDDDDGSEIGREGSDGKMQIHFRVELYNGSVKLFVMGSATDWLQKIIQEGQHVQCQISPFPVIGFPVTLVAHYNHQLS